MSFPDDRAPNDHRIIAEDVASLLTERLTETGTAYLRGLDLHYRVAENSDDVYLGEVDDAETVQTALDEYFGIATARTQ